MNCGSPSREKGSCLWPTAGTPSWLMSPGSSPGRQRPSPRRRSVTYSPDPSLLERLCGRCSETAARTWHPSTRVATEVIGKKDERLDLVAFDERGSERVLIEVKFWAGLTSKQPEEYLERLPRDGDPAVLLFVAPEQRLVTLWAEIRRRAKARCELGDDTGIEGLMSVMVDGSPRRLMLTSWRRLLDVMRSRANADGDSSTRRDILQLGALCERQDRDAFLPLRSEEFAPAIPRRMRDMQKLVNDATTRARRRGFVNHEGTEGRSAGPRIRSMAQDREG